MLYLYEKKAGEAWNGKEQTRRARELLLLALEREYDFAELPEIEKTPKGKPYFQAYPQIFFNYSHCRKGILCGVSRAPIGVDMETARPFRETPAKRICHPKEWDTLLKAQDAAGFFISLWVLKEAYLKYTGEGIRRRLSELDFSEFFSKEGSAGAGEARFAQTPDAGKYGTPVCGQLPDGCTAKLWKLQDVFVCACGEHPEELFWADGNPYGKDGNFAG